MKHLLRILSLALTVMLGFSCGAAVFADGETTNKYEEGMLIKDMEPVKDYAYSFALIGDTQIVTAHYTDKLSCIYDWILENKDEKKIKYVFGLGDITDSSSSYEWAAAKKEMDKLRGVVPNMHIRGNHDKPEDFIATFQYKEYADQISGSYQNTMQYTYHKFKVGKTKYLALNIDVCPPDDVLNWANGVIEEHPDHNVIIVTHIYKYPDGSLYNNKKYGQYGTNLGPDIWEKLVKNHKNIVLVLAGHVGTNNIVVHKREGAHGNTVTEILVDPQEIDKEYGPGGYVAMLYFSEDGKTVQTEYISTVHDAYFLEENQFTFEVNVIKGKNYVPLYCIGATLLVLVVLILVFRKKIFRKRASNI